MAHGDQLSTAASATGRMNSDSTTSVIYKSLDESLELVIRQRPSESSSHGFSVWDSSVVMCRYLETTKRREALAGRTVLEIGSGCGLGGIFAARYLGASVIMSDLPEILDILRLNAASSRSAGSSDHDEGGALADGRIASISALDFDDPNGPSVAVKKALALKPRSSNLKAEASSDAATAEAGPCHKVDLIIGSDILFSESLVVPLLETVGVTMQEHGARRAVIVHETRCTDLTSRFEREARSRFALSRVRRKKLPPEWCPANIDVYILSPPIRGWAEARPAEGREGEGECEGGEETEALGAATGGASGVSASKGAAAPAVSRATTAVDQCAEPVARDPPAGSGAVAPSESQGAPLAAAAGKARRSNRAVVREMLRRKRATDKDHDATLK